MTTQRINIDLQKNDVIIKYSNNDDEYEMSDSVRKSLREDGLQFIKDLSNNNIERKKHLQMIHSDIFNVESYEWLIADAKLNDDKIKEMEYAKKYHDDSLDTVKVGIASYTYAKCLIEYEDKMNDAKEMFKKAFFIGGYLKAIEKLKEYFNDDIKNEYK
ncbi:6254_t:CDS:1, partial [Cetraspora pellucida]